MSKNSANYKELFSLRTHQVGTTNGPYISPDGVHLLVSTPNNLALIDTRVGGTQAFIDTGVAVDITAVAWINNIQGLIGCSNGAVYTVDFLAANLFGYSPASIAYAFTDLEQAMAIFRYNPEQKVLLVGYEYGVSVWKKFNSSWRRVNHMKLVLPFDEPLGISTIEILDKAGQQVFLAGSFGNGVWKYSEKTPFCADTRAFCSSALSLDGKSLALSTLEQSICVWSIDAKGPRSSNARNAVLPSGKDLAHLSPRVPIAMTPSNVVVSGSQVGDVLLMDTNNKTLGTFCAGPNLAITGLQCHNDRLYISLVGPFGYVIVKGYSNEPNAVREFEETRELIKNHIWSTNAPLPITHIDLQRLPKVNSESCDFIREAPKSVVPRPSAKPMRTATITVRTKDGNVRRVSKNQVPDKTPTILEGCFWAMKVFFAGWMLGRVAYHVSHQYSGEHTNIAHQIKRYIELKNITLF
ncbi:hypothetical protein FRC11_005441 [Ceratobasidium sp. 423]|nr:hypothetical protein FRC11_005441 [Ceratobasidium sp. 423]